MDIESTKAVAAPPQLPLYRTLDGESADWWRLLLGLRLKLIALFIFLSTPLAVWLAWRTSWQPWWPVLLSIIAIAIAVDLSGRVLVLLSGIGKRYSIGVSLIAQGTGVIVGVLMLALVAEYGFVFAAAVAVFFQVISAISFTYYLGDVAHLINDDSARQQAAATRYSIYCVLSASTFFSVILLVLGVCLAIATLLTFGYAFYPALWIVTILAMLAALPLMGTLVALYSTYGMVLSRLHSKLSR